MIDVQDLIAWTCRPGVNAGVVEFDQHIFAQFITSKFALLIFDAFDLRALHHLHIEFHQLEGDASQWINTL